jgi:hypothetical protein
MNLPRLLSRPWITAALAFFVICALGYIVLDKGVLPWVAGRFKSTVRCRISSVRKEVGVDRMQPPDERTGKSLP